MDAVRETPHAELIGQAWRSTLTRMLLISFGLHAAVVAIVQPRPYPAAPEVVVISARLTGPAPAQAQPDVPPPPATTIAEPIPEAIPTPASVAKPEPVPVVAQKPAPPEPTPAAQPMAVPPRPVANAESSPTPRTMPESAPSLPSVPVMIDTNWYEARQLDVQPAAAAAINPRYPPDAVRRGIEGTVKLKLRIDEFGVVREADVEEGDPPGAFDDSALEAFKQGRFLPARKDGRPVRALIYIRVRYELGD